jgi:Polyketide cyclase / dehydrase and lipid transport
MRIPKMNKPSYYGSLLILRKFSMQNNEATHHPLSRPITTVAFVLLVLTGCTSIQSTAPNSDTNANKDLPMTFDVQVVRKAVIAKDIQSIFNFITAEDVLPKVLTGYGPLPAVTHTSDVSGSWETPNATRTVHLADKSTVREQMLERTPYKSFSYRVWEIGNPIVAALANGATGQWIFTETAQGTEIQWTYTFKAKNALAAVPLSMIGSILWRGYMDVCLKNTAKHMTTRS